MSTLLRISYIFFRNPACFYKKKKKIRKQSITVSHENPERTWLVKLIGNKAINYSYLGYELFGNNTNTNYYLEIIIGNNTTVLGNMYFFVGTIYFWEYYLQLLLSSILLSSILLFSMVLSSIIVSSNYEILWSKFLVTFMLISSLLWSWYLLSSKLNFFRDFVFQLLVHVYMPRCVVFLFFVTY